MTSSISLSTDTNNKLVINITNGFNKFTGHVDSSQFPSYLRQTYDKIVTLAVENFDKSFEDLSTSNLSTPLVISNIYDETFKLDSISPFYSWTIYVKFDSPFLKINDEIKIPLEVELMDLYTIVIEYQEKVKKLQLMYDTLLYKYNSKYKEVNDNLFSKYNQINKSDEKSLNPIPTYVPKKTYIDSSLESSVDSMDYIIKKKEVNENKTIPDELKSYNNLFSKYNQINKSYEKSLNPISTHVLKQTCLESSSESELESSVDSSMDSDSSLDSKLFQRKKTKSNVNSLINQTQFKQEDNVPKEEILKAMLQILEIVRKYSTCANKSYPVPTTEQNVGELLPDEMLQNFYNFIMLGRLSNV